MFRDVGCGTAILAAQRHPLQQPQCDEQDGRRKAEAPPPIPASNTPWEEIYRANTGQLSEGAVLELAVKYRGTSAKTPRHNH